MHVHEAKDFLINQAAQQAAIDGVPLSDLERRMMYFSESDPSCEDPIALNNEFAAEYDEKNYEPKIKRLLHHAHKRVKNESLETRNKWDNAVRTLRKGDHYILVMLGSAPVSRIRPRWLGSIAAIFVVVLFYALALLVFGSKRDLRRGQAAPIDKYLPAMNPAAEHVLQLFIVLIFVCALFPDSVGKLAGFLYRSIVRTRKYR